MRSVHLDTREMAVPVDGAPPSVPARLPPAELLALADGAPHPEAELGHLSGLAPASLRASMAALAAAGMEVREAAEGWRLREPLDWIDPAAVRRGLPDGVRARVGCIENHWRLDSTSSECLRRAEALPDASFVFADWQFAGRGRRGHRWVSPPAANLQCSCFKRFDAGFAALAGLSLAVGVALVEALSDLGIRGVALKWPNDLVHAEAKLGGVLVELAGNAAGACHAVIGIGINVRLSDASRRALARPCVDLAELSDGRAPRRGQLAGAVIARLVPALDDFARRGFGAFADAWAQRDALAGRPVRIEGAQGNFDGVAMGVDVRGALRVRTPAGLRLVEAGEVTVRAR